MPLLFLLVVLFAIGAVVGGNLLQHRAAQRALAPVGDDGGTVARDAGAHRNRGDLRGVDPLARFGLALRRGIRRPSDNSLVFLGCVVLYLAVGAVLVFHYGSIVGDAQSRVADAFYVFYSRDPHLAAIGFVWNPLPSLAAALLFPFRPLFPGLVDRAFAGNVISALCMAGAVVQLRKALWAMRTTNAIRWVLLAAFALNPMVVYYGANGMSEAMYLLFLMMAVRHLMTWARNGGLTPLAWAGIALAFGYLTRYEAIAASAAAAAVVWAIGYLRAEGVRRPRVALGLTDSLVVALPSVAAFVGWAGVSAVITGHPFEQFASQYGNASLLRATGGAANFRAQAGDAPLPVYGLVQILVYGPLLPLLVVGALVVGRKARDTRVLVAVSVIGAVTAFSWLSFASGNTFGWLRYYLPVTLLSPICVGLIAAGRKAQASAATLVLALAVVVAALSIGSTTLGMKSAWLNPGAKTQTGFISGSQAIARDIDSRHLPSGSVLFDSYNPCLSFALMMSDHPHQFVVTSDRDFQPMLQDPGSFGVRYFVVPPGGGAGTIDAVNRAYPELYANGSGIATLVRTYHQAGCPPYRLYRLKGGN